MNDKTATVNLTRDQLADILGALLNEMEANNAFAARIARGAFDDPLDKAVFARRERLNGAYNAINMAMGELEKKEGEQP